MSSPRIAAVVLAAGASTRLGEPKQLVLLNGERLLERAIRVAHEAGCAPVIVVLGASAQPIEAECNLRTATVVHNNEWQEGMASSIRAGVRALIDVDGIVLMTCDQPAVTAGHLQSLMISRGVTASGYADRRGVPAYFPATEFAALRSLQGDAGARDLLRTARVVDLPHGELDLDTVEDIERARSLFSK